MIVRPATRADLAHICDSLWPQSYQEAEAFGHPDPALRYAALFGERGLLTWTVAAEQPIAVGGLIPDGGVYWTWFAARAEFAERPMATKAVRKLAQHAAATVAPVWVDCLSALPEAARWFRTVGFAPVYNTGRLTRYRFRC